MIKENLEYLKDNPKGYWFKAKLYGWGWAPAKWQGWAVLGVYMVFLLALSFRLKEVAAPKEVFHTFILPIFLITAILIAICYKTGEKPRWQWGPPKTKGTDKKDTL